MTLFPLEFLMLIAPTQKGTITAKDWQLIELIRVRAKSCNHLSFAPPLRYIDLLSNHQQFAWIPVWDDHGMITIICNTCSQREGS